MLKLCWLIRQSWLAAWSADTILKGVHLQMYKVHSIKVWSKAVSEEKIFKKCLPNVLFLAVAAILVVGRGLRIQLLKGTTQLQSLPSLVQIGPVVSEEKIRM